MENLITLDTLTIHESLKIKKLTIEGPLRRRLLDLGFVPGAVIKVIRKSPLGDPVAILVSDTMIALRKEECRKIYGTKVNENEEQY
ncbi:MAG: ferrous iron transport protein A [Bacillaceae bacterium]